MPKAADRAKCPKPAISLPNKKTKPCGERGRKKADSTEIPKGVQALLDEMMPYVEKCLPESTCAALIGLDYGVWENYCTRYPALRLAIKRVHAQRFAEWQATVEAGAQGWQAAATLLERRDPMNWSRSAAAAKPQAKNPLSRAIKKR